MNLDFNYHQCEECGEETKHLHVKEDDYEFEACVQCGDKRNQRGYRRTMYKTCSECKQYEPHVHYNTLITGVKRGFRQKKKKWICAGCGHRS